MIKTTRVLISYAHDNDEHKAKVLALADKLRANGVESWIDRYVENDPVDWPSWMHDQLEKADFVLCIASPLFLKRFERKEEKGKGRGAKWEGAIIQLSLYEAEGDSGKFIPVSFSRDDESNIPKVLRGPTRYVLEDEKSFQNLLRRLTNQPRIVMPPVGTTPILPAETQTPSAGTAIGAAITISPAKTTEAEAVLRSVEGGNTRGFSNKFQLLSQGEQTYVVQGLLGKSASDSAALRALAEIAELAPASVDVPALTTHLMRSILLRGDVGVMAAFMKAWPLDALRNAEGKIREAFFTEVISIMNADQYEDVNRITPAVVRVQSTIPAVLHAAYVEALFDQADSGAFQGQPAALMALKDFPDELALAAFAVITAEFLSWRKLNSEGCPVFLKAQKQKWPAEKKELFGDYLSMNNRDFMEKYHHSE